MTAGRLDDRSLADDPFPRDCGAPGVDRTAPGRDRGLAWDWIGTDYIEWPPEAVKNGRRHRIPIGPETQAILAALPRFTRPYVFPAARQRSEHTTTINGWSKAKAAFDPECGVTGWTLHDLRRTYATVLQSLGVRLKLRKAS